jgi:hypothetical protein
MISALGWVLLVLCGAPSVVFYFFVVTIGQHINLFALFGLAFLMLWACRPQRRRPGGRP